MARGVSTVVCFVVCSLALGCGGSSPGAQSADDNAASEPSDDDLGPKAGAEPEDKPDDELKETGKLKSTSGGPTPEAQSANDTQAILQLVIEDPELDPYLKLGEPGRFPLKLSGSAVPQGIELMKSTKPVVMSPAPKDKKDPVLVITELESDGKNATVSYRYDIEGIRGTAYLKKSSHGWELTRSRVVEH